VRFITSRFRERLAAVLGANDPPERIAAAWALGIGVALSPFFFLHTILALALAFALRLNKPDVMLGTLVMNPWTQPVYFLAAIKLGSSVTGMRVAWDAVPAPGELFDRHFWSSGNEFVRSILVNWGVGATLISILVGPAIFVALWSLIPILRRRRATSPHPPRS